MISRLLQARLWRLNKTQELRVHLKLHQWLNDPHVYRNAPYVKLLLVRKCQEGRP